MGPARKLTNQGNPMKFTIQITSKGASEGAEIELARQAILVMTSAMHTREPVELVLGTPIGDVSLVSGY